LPVGDAREYSARGAIGSWPVPDQAKKANIIRCRAERRHCLCGL